MQFRICGIEKDDAPIRKQPGKQARESAAQRLAGAVGLAQEIGDGGIAQNLNRGLHYGLNLVGEVDGADRGVFHIVTRGR